MPLVVMDIALDAAGRGDYEIVQRNLGLAEDGFYTPKPSYHLLGNGGLLRYSYCTPNFIMGSLACEARRYEDWVMISSQNRWMGIIYNKNPDARIFPLCKTGEDERAYNQMWAVQKNGTMIVQKLKNQLHSRGAGEMQVWISKQGLSSPVENKGWVFVDCGKSFTAIKPVNGGYKWLNKKAGKWMVCKDQYTPIIFEVVPKPAYPSMSAFQGKIIANNYSLQNNILHYNSLDGNLLTLPTDYKGLPSVNGKEVNLAPDLVWDSPFIASTFNSGIVKIQKGDRTLNLDFLENSQPQSAPLNTSGKIPQELAASTKAILLDATQAKGGEFIQTDRETAAVLFPATAPVNDKITWAIDGSLPVGLWQVDLDFYQPESSFSPNQILRFEGGDGEKLATLDLYYSGFTKGTYTRSIGFYSSRSVSAIALVKNAQRNVNTVAVRSIRILPATYASLEKLQSVFQLPVSGQQVALPFPLQSGVYVVNSAKPIALNWISPEGNAFATPLNSEVRVFIDQSIQPSVISGEPVAFIQLTHYPTSISPDMTSAGNFPLTGVVDSTKNETRTLKLIGYRGSEMPKVDLFPSGKSMAVVTSWDDGQAMDVQVMECLSKYGMKGTFYMNRGSAMNTRLDELEAKGMEIGSHSWSHPPFYNSSPDRCLAEAVEMRRYLEKILGHPVISFSYPFVYQPAYDAGGDYVLRSLRQAGYWSGRTTTTGDNRIDSIPEPLAMRPNFHFKVGAAKTKEKLDELLQKPGSILYLWGHSYELAGDGTKILEEVLASLANHPEVWYATLGELMTWQFTRNHLQIEQASTKGGGKSFTLKMPWLHPWLQKLPLSLTVPDGVTEVLWQGKPIPVVNRRVQLVW
jgi:peptidoglycan/xylan/chitin deacetylase (PgdA/CDA1 family)